MVNSDNDFPQVTAQLNTCKATQTYKRTSTIWIASPAARLPGEDLKKKRERKAKPGLKPPLEEGKATLRLFTRWVVITSQQRFFFAPQAYKHTLTHSHLHT